MLPMSLSATGGAAGPSNSGQTTPGVFQDGAFQVGGSANSASAAQQATQADYPPSYGFATDYPPPFSSGGGLSMTTVILIGGGLICAALLLRKLR